MGCTDDEACLHAEITPATLYNYQNANPEFLEQQEYWKNNPEVGGSSPPIDTKLFSKMLRCFIEIKYLNIFYFSSTRTMARPRGCGSRGSPALKEIKFKIKN